MTGNSTFQMIFAVSESTDMSVERQGGRNGTFGNKEV